MVGPTANWHLSNLTQIDEKKVRIRFEKKAEPQAVTFVAAGAPMTGYRRDGEFESSLSASVRASVSSVA
jgi:hypothetical protein